MSHRLVWVAAVGVTLLADRPAAAQAERYELGRRLQAFEREWDDVKDGAARKRALDIVPAATTQFLSLRFGEAGRTLDLAARSLRSADPPTPAGEWAAALCAIPEKRLIDGAVAELAVTVKPLYTVKAALPKDFKLAVGFAGQTLIPVPVEKFPAAVKVPVPALKSGEREAVRTLVLEAGPAGAVAVADVAQVADLAGRLEKLKAAVAAWPALDTIEKATARDHAELLAEVADGMVPENRADLGAMLRRAERFARDPGPYFGTMQPGDHALSVPLGGKNTAPVRVLVPKTLDPKKPVPVVVALHGAGGSENLFFEGYGNGRAVKECEARGWVLVTTRGGFTAAPPAAAVLDKLADRFPIDPKRAFLVGHSMGAAQAVDLVQRHPGRFAAVAALGGGGRVRDPKPFAGLPVFVGVGEKDFALRGARSLHQALADGGVKAATLREYPGLEHLLIVREALPDVFAVFDAAAK